MALEVQALKAQAGDAERDLAAAQREAGEGREAQRRAQAAEAATVVLGTRLREAEAELDSTVGAMLVRGIQMDNDAGCAVLETYWAVRILTKSSPSKCVQKKAQCGGK